MRNFEYCSSRQGGVSFNKIPRDNIVFTYYLLKKIDLGVLYAEYPIRSLTQLLLAPNLWK